MRQPERDPEILTKAEAKTPDVAWIEEGYNRKRCYSSIGMLTPVEFEEHQLQTTGRGRAKFDLRKPIGDRSTIRL